MSAKREADDARPYGRRAFLLLLAGGLSSLALGGAGEPDRSRRSRRAFSQLVGNLLPVGGWRIYTISGSMPVFDPKAWRLEIGGLVERPRSFTYDELRALPRAAAGLDVPLRHGLDGATTSAGRACASSTCSTWSSRCPRRRRSASSRSSSPYDDSLTLEQARLPDVMLALELDGQPLSRPHGAPARVVIPEMYGYKGVKWLDADGARRARSRPATGKSLGYDQNAWVGRSNGYGSSRAACRASRAPSARVHWVHATAFLDPARVGPLPLPAEPRRGGRPAAAAEGRSTSTRRSRGRSRSSLVVVARRPARLRATAREIDRFDADDRDWLRGRRRAAGPPQRRPEAERDRHRRVRDPLRGHRLLPLVRRARHALPLRRERCSSTTG